MMRRVPVVVMLALAGCGPALPPAAVVPGTGVDPALCGAAALQEFVGQPVTRLPGDAAVGTVRVIRPGQPVTEDFSPTRLNVSLDGADVIAALGCG